MDKYVDLALQLKMKHAKIIGIEEIVFDPKAMLKCTWGCEYTDMRSFKCSWRGTGFQERLDALKTYRHVLLVHASSGHEVSKACVAIERQAFLDGNHFAFAVRYCNLCPECAVDKDKPCIQPQKVRPCESLFGIDVYRTAAKQDLPCYPLPTKEEIQNRYGFVFLA